MESSSNFTPKLSGILCKPGTENPMRSHYLPSFTMKDKQIDVSNSWLSDHPLVTADYTTKKGEEAYKLGCFNVLSRAASSINDNAPYAKQFNDKYMTDIFKGIFMAEDGIDKYKANYKEVFNSFIKNEIEGKHITCTDLNSMKLNEAISSRISSFLGDITSTLTHEGIEAILKQDLIKKCEKTNTDKLEFKKAVESVHACLIDRVFKTSSIGGFQYTQINDGLVNNESYLKAKTVFLSNQLETFFSNGSKHILICPEFDYETKSESETQTQTTTTTPTTTTTTTTTPTPTTLVGEIDKVIIPSKVKKILLGYYEQLGSTEEEKIRNMNEMIKEKQMHTNHCRVAFYNSNFLDLESGSVRCYKYDGTGKYCIDIFILKVKDNNERIFVVAIHGESTSDETDFNTEQADKESTKYVTKKGELNFIINTISEYCNAKDFNYKNDNVVVLGDFNAPFIYKSELTSYYHELKSIDIEKGFYIENDFLESTFAKLKKKRAIGLINAQIEKGTTGDGRAYNTDFIFTNFFTLYSPKIRNTVSKLIPSLNYQSEDDELAKILIEAVRKLHNIINDKNTSPKVRPEITLYNKQIEKLLELPGFTRANVMGLKIDYNEGAINMAMLLDKLKNKKKGHLNLIYENISSPELAGGGNYIKNMTKHNKIHKNKSIKKKYKRNKTKRNKTKRNKTKRTKTKRTKTKRTKHKRNKTKRTKHKRNKTNKKK